MSSAGEALSNQSVGWVLHRPFEPARQTGQYESLSRPVVTLNAESLAATLAYSFNSMLTREVPEDAYFARRWPNRHRRDMNQLGTPNILDSAITVNPNLS